jgi:hypothetical protein
MLRSKEIIITAQNNTKGRLEIFSTVKPEESLLHMTNGNLSLVGTSCYISYLGLLPPGEYERAIECVFRSTSAVPVVFPSFKFNGDEYSDGGVSFSSPLSSLLILAEIKEVLYVFPEDIDKPNIVESKTAIDAMLGYLSQISRSNYIHDRCNFLTTLCCGDFSRLKVLSGEFKDLPVALSKTKDIPRFVELFPLLQTAPSITEKITYVSAMKRLFQQQNFAFRIHYT